MYNWNYMKLLSCQIGMRGFFPFIYTFPPVQSALLFHSESYNIFSFKNLAADITWVESKIHDDAAKIIMLILQEAYNM